MSTFDMTVEEIAVACDLALQKQGYQVLHTMTSSSKMLRVVTPEGVAVHLVITRARK